MCANGTLRDYDTFFLNAAASSRCKVIFLETGKLNRHSFKSSRRRKGNRANVYSKLLNKGTIFSSKAVCHKKK